MYVCLLNLVIFICCHAEKKTSPIEIQTFANVIKWHKSLYLQGNGANNGDVVAHFPRM